MWNSTGCPSINTKAAQANFWNKHSAHWDQHRIGWAVSGACATVTVFITFYSVMSHALNYRVPAEQRQIIRILYMPLIFAVIGFFSYRYFRDYTYYSVSEVLYEAIVVSAFMMLLIESFASASQASTSQEALLQKDKQKLPLPFCFWRYRPTKDYFMYTIKWSVMQYTIIQPCISMISIATQFYNLLCVSSFSPKFANLWLTIFSTMSNGIAVYGLVIFYELTKTDLKGRRPAAKFWCVQIIVTVPFIQQLIFSSLQSSGVVKGSKFWTSTNVANGLNSLTTCTEMVLFSLFMIWAFPVTEYENTHRPRLPVWKALWDSINLSDFAVESWRSIMFFIRYARCQPRARSRTVKQNGGRTSFAAAFMRWGASSASNRWTRISQFHRSRPPMKEKVDVDSMPTKEVWEDSSPSDEVDEVDLTEGREWTVLNEEVV